MIGGRLRAPTTARAADPARAVASPAGHRARSGCRPEDKSTRGRPLLPPVLSTEDYSRWWPSRDGTIGRHPASGPAGSPAATWPGPHPPRRPPALRRSIPDRPANSATSRPASPRTCGHDPGWRAASRWRVACLSEGRTAGSTAATIPDHRPHAAGPAARLHDAGRRVCRHPASGSDRRPAARLQGPGVPLWRSARRGSWRCRRPAIAAGGPAPARPRHRSDAADPAAGADRPNRRGPGRPAVGADSGPATRLEGTRHPVRWPTQHGAASHSYPSVTTGEPATAGPGDRCPATVRPAGPAAGPATRLRERSDVLGAETTIGAGGGGPRAHPVADGLRPVANFGYG